jgi:anti-sigma regulatory factor (Ser/Thr protein kinase)
MPEGVGLKIDERTRDSLVVRDVTASDLQPLRHMVRRLARGFALSTRRADQLTLAVSEVATNAIRHAAGCVKVIVSRTPDGSHVVVEVCDHGPGIPTWVRLQWPAGDAISGRGLYLIHLLCDRVIINSSTAGTRVSLMMATRN